MYDPRMAAAYHARVVEDAIHEIPFLEVEKCGGGGGGVNGGLLIYRLIFHIISLKDHALGEHKEKKLEYLGKKYRAAK